MEKEHHVVAKKGVKFHQFTKDVHPASEDERSLDFSVGSVQMNMVKQQEALQIDIDKVAASVKNKGEAFSSESKDRDFTLELTNQGLTGSLKF